MDGGKALVDMTPGLIGRDEVGELLLRVAEDLVEVVLLAQAVDGTKRGKESNYNFDSFSIGITTKYCKNNKKKNNYVKKKNNNIVKTILYDLSQLSDNQSY